MAFLLKPVLPFYVNDFAEVSRVSEERRYPGYPQYNTGLFFLASEMMSYLSIECGFNADLFQSDAQTGQGLQKF